MGIDAPDEAYPRQDTTQTTYPYVPSWYEDDSSTTCSQLPCQMQNVSVSSLQTSQKHPEYNSPISIAARQEMFEAQRKYTRPPLQQEGQAKICRQSTSQNAYVKQNQQNCSHLHSRKQQSPLFQQDLLENETLQQPPQNARGRYQKPEQSGIQPLPRKNHVHGRVGSQWYSDPQQPAQLGSPADWLMIAGHSLRWPPIDILPGLSPDWHLPLGPDSQIFLPHYVFGVRSLKPKDRLDAFNKIVIMGRALEQTYPGNVEWKNIWKAIFSFSKELLDGEREYYERLSTLDPLIKTRLLLEQMDPVRMYESPERPWYAGFKPRQRQVVAIQGASRISPLSNANTKGCPPTVRDVCQHPFSHSQDGSMAGNPRSQQKPPQPNDVHRDVDASSSLIVSPSDAPGNAQNALPTNQSLLLSDYSHSFSSPKPYTAHSQRRKRKEHDAEEQEVHSKKLKMDNGQGNLLQRHDEIEMGEVLDNQTWCGTSHMKTNNMQICSSEDDVRDNTTLAAAQALATPLTLVRKFLPCPPTKASIARRTAMETVLHQARLLEASTKEQRELADSERIVIGDINVAQLISANMHFEKIITMIATHLENAEQTVLEQEKLASSKQVVMQPNTIETPHSEHAPIASTQSLIELPTILDAPEEAWHEEELSSERTSHFKQELDAVSNEYLAEFQSRVLDDETPIDWDEWEKQKIAEYRYQTEGVWVGFPGVADEWNK